MPILVAFLMIIASGCSIIGHLDQALVLNDYGNNKTYQKKLIKINDDAYDRLALAFKENRLRDYKTKNDIKKAFGEPLQVKMLEGSEERWLYRYMISHQAKEKIYLYFRGEGLSGYEQKSNEIMSKDKE